MRYVLPAILFAALVTGCKLMKKNPTTNETKTGKTMSQATRPVEWAHHTSIYEVNMRQATPAGTINAFMGELPRLRELGVQTLWFMPLTPIAEKNRKGSLGSYYACSDYTSISSEFGTLDDFKNLVRTAHEMGFKVIIDWVANHTGWDHKWTREHPDYYQKDTATCDFKIASGMDDIIELDFKNPALRKAMIDAMLFWVKECDIDGFRCDLAFWVELDFWKEARPQIDAVKPLFWLGEYDELEKPEYGEAFDASYSWTWMHRTEDFYKKQEPLDSLISILKRYDDLGDRTMRTWFTSNHDENSWNGTEFEKYGDMAGALAVFSATWNGVPLLYCGQEWGNTKRIAFFEKDTIQPGPEAARLTAFYKTLLALKRDHPALRAGDTAVHTYRLATTAPREVMAYMRKNGNREILVVLNLSRQKDLHFDITDERVSGTWRNIFSGAANDFSGNRSFEMQDWEYLVYEK